MDGSATLYDDDIVAWAEAQAGSLRALARQPGLSNALDWENVAEEIESVGRSQVTGVESKLAKMFVHLMKLVSDPDALPQRGWRAEVIAFQRSMIRQHTPSMSRQIDLDQVWRHARDAARQDLAEFGAVLHPGLGPACPFAWRELLSPEFDVDTALLRVAETCNKSE
jgi:hypothetical protein